MSRVTGGHGRALRLYSLGCALIAAAGCATVSTRAPAPPLLSADAIVVLGNRPPVDASGEVRPELRARVEAAVALWRRGLAPRLLMSGGRAPSGHIEAKVMRDLAIRLGVPPSVISVESQSSDTIENARLSMAILCRDEAPPCYPAVIVVTSPYHLRRAGYLFDCAGARVQLAASSFPTQLGHRLREATVRLYYGIVDECRQARSGVRNTTSVP